MRPGPSPRGHPICAEDMPSHGHCRPVDLRWQPHIPSVALWGHKISVFKCRGLPLKKGLSSGDLESSLTSSLPHPSPTLWLLPRPHVPQRSEKSGNRRPHSEVAPLPPGSYLQGPPTPVLCSSGLAAKRGRNYLFDWKNSAAAVLWWCGLWFSNILISFTF